MQYGLIGEKLGHIVIIHQAVAEKKDIEHFVLLGGVRCFGSKIGFCNWQSARSVAERPSFL